MAQNFENKSQGKVAVCILLFPVTHLPESWEARFSACLNWRSANEKTQEDDLAAGAPVFLSNRGVESRPSGSLPKLPLSETIVSLRALRHHDKREKLRRQQAQHRKETKKRARTWDPGRARSVCAHAHVCAGARADAYKSPCVRMWECTCSCSVLFSLPAEQSDDLPKFLMFKILAFSR